MIKHLFKFVAIVGCAVALAVFTTSYLAGAEATTSPSTKPAVTKMENGTLHLRLNPGDYLFLGQDTGTQGKMQADIGADPLEKCRIRPDTPITEWDLEISLKEARNSKGEPVWSARGQLRSTQSNGLKFSHFDSTWEDMPATSEKATSTIGKVDVVEDREELRSYRVPYLSVNGDAHSIIIVVAKQPSLVRNVACVPKTFILFNWNKWQLLPYDPNKVNWEEVTPANATKP